LIECTRTDSPADLMRQTFPPAPDQARLSPDTKSEPTPRPQPEHAISRASKEEDTFGHRRQISRPGHGLG
jgi:hypothetical protein